MNESGMRWRSGVGHGGGGVGMNAGVGEDGERGEDERLLWGERVRRRWGRYRRLLGRGWWQLALVLGPLLGGGVAEVLRRFERPVYVSSGRMIVNVKLTIPEGSVYTEELNNFLGTQAALMQSAGVLERAEEKARGTAGEGMGARVASVRVFIVPKTTIFLVEGKGEDGGFTQRYVQGCMDEYIQLKKEMRGQTSDLTVAGMTEEIGRLGRELGESDRELALYQGSNGVSVSTLQEMGNSAGSYAVRLGERVAGLRSERALLERLGPEQWLEEERGKTGGSALGDFAVWRVEGSGPGAVGGGGAGVAGGVDFFRLRQQVLELKAEREELGIYLRPKHPKMKGLEEEIGRRERYMGMARVEAREQMVRRKGLLDLEIEQMEGDVREWEGRALEASRKGGEYERLRSKRQRTQGLYDRLLASMETLDVNKQVSPESVTVMERASAPVVERSGWGRRIGWGAAAGLGVVMLCLGLAERLDDRFESVSEARELLGERVVGQIPYEALAGGGKGWELLRDGDGRYGWVEGYRNLRSSVLSGGADGERLRRLLVTSSVPGEGKSVTAANLGISLARAGARVLLMDADLRKGVLHRMFGCEGKAPGLALALRESASGLAGGGGVGGGGRERDGEATETGAEAAGGWEADGLAGLVQETGVENLWLAWSGGPAGDAGELLLRGAFERLVEEAGNEYDFVILDSAPVMAADDAAGLSRLVDGVLFVVRAGETSARVARAALDMVGERQGCVTGLVLNGVRRGGVEDYRRYEEYHCAGNAT